MFAFKKVLEKASEIYPSGVVFMLKTSSGEMVKAFSIPVENADFFEGTLKSLENRYRTEAGEIEP